MPETQAHAEHSKHDESYKLLFSAKRAVADLLRGFAGDCARDLDLETLAKLPASFVARNLSQRHTDMLWKVRTTDGTWLYLLVLLEFQRTVNPRMAMRMLDYTVRALRALPKEALGPHGEYPPLLAIVIYNGDQRWTAATDTADLFAPPGEALLGYLPRHRYLLLDLGALDPSGLPPDNVVSAIALLEQARSMERLEELGIALADRLRQAGERELLGAFEAWVSQVLVERPLPGDKKLQLEVWDKEKGPMSTLAERVKKWGAELNQEWLEKGISQGISQGIERGRQEGIKRGREEGIERERRKAIERDRALVRHHATLKFGRDTAARLAPIVVALSDPGRIAKVATAVIECETAEEFITRARKA